MLLKSFLRQIRLKRTIIFLLWAGFCLCFLSVCSKRKPTEPEPEPKNYLLYALNEYEGCVYVINTSADTLVGTICIGNPPYGNMLLGISPDGSMIHVHSSEHHTFYEIDTRTKEIKYKGQNSGVYTTPDGKLIVQPFGGIHFYDACTHELVHHDTLTLYPPTFDKNTPIVYGAIGTGEVGVFNYHTFSWEKTFEIVLSEHEGVKPKLSALVLSPDGKTLYFTGSISSFGVFGVYDLTEDSLRYEYYVPLDWEHSLFKIAYLTTSLDGKYVYITDPGGHAMWPPYPEGEIWVFDTQVYAFSFISTDTIVPPGLAGSMATCDIEVTPDGKKAYVSDWWYTIVVIDLETNNIIDTIQVEKGGCKATYLAIQNRP